LSPLLRPLQLLALALLCLALVACGGSASAVRSGTAHAVTSTDNLPPPDTTNRVGAYVGSTDYRVGPQDLLEISVFQVPDLNRSVRVNTGGQISLPLIGVVDAGGRTAQELEHLIADKLSQSYLQNPQVSVFVKEYSSQRVTVEGAVKKPGIYSLTGRTTLLQAVVMAGGMDQYANLQGVVVFRVIDGKKMAAVFDFKQIRAGNIEDPQIYGDDIIVVDQSGTRSALRRVIEALPVLNIFGVY